MIKKGNYKELMTDATNAELDRRNITLVSLKNSESGKVKYAKKSFLNIYKGFDMLENLMIVRMYIQRKHDIDLKLLELLIFLYPKQYFLQSDYAKMAKNFEFRRVKNIVDTGHVRIMTVGENQAKHLYCLSISGKNIVRDFYQCLSGETKMQENKKGNPMALPTATPFDKKRLLMIKEMNKLTPSDRMRTLFE